MPTVAQLPLVGAVTDDDRFTGNDGTTTSTWLATTVKTYMTATVAAQIAALQAADTALQSVDTTHTANIATNTASIVALALSTSNSKTASYTFVLTDGQVPFVTVTMNVATANALTIPPNASVAFPLGTILAAEQWGVGTTTWTAGAGVTIRSRGSLVAMGGQWAAASARQISANTWLLSGDLA